MASESLRLSQGISSDVNDFVLSLNLTFSDVTELKNNINLVTDVTNAYVAFRSNTFTDTSGLSVVAINDGNGKPADEVRPDTIAPKLDSFNINLNNGILVLIFDEPVTSASLNTSLITIHSSSTLPSFNVSLTGLTSIFTQSLSTELVVTLLESDLNSLQLLRNLAVDNTSTFLLLDSDAVTDTSGNSFEAQISGTQVNEYVNDETSPVLVSFSSFDLNEGLVTLTLSEPVDVASINASGPKFRVIKDETSRESTVAEERLKEEIFRLELDASCKVIASTRMVEGSTNSSNNRKSWFELRSKSNSSRLGLVVSGINSCKFLSFKFVKSFRISLT